MKRQRPATRMGGGALRSLTVLASLAGGCAPRSVSVIESLPEPVLTSQPAQPPPVIPLDEQDAGNDSPGRAARDGPA